jgi:hypothetical protein
MKEYIEKIYTKLHEAMEKPVTLGSAEEVGMYAKTIRRLEKLDFRADEPDAAAFDRETAIHWAEHMQNADGSTGPHWTMEQTTAVMVSKGYHYDPAVWYAAMNMIYSDYFKTAKKHGVNTVEFYADMAEAFLDDKDAGGPEEKISAYYHCIAS